ncbi:MAG: OsmC family protein [Gammaproteobacteria bacterium]
MDETPVHRYRATCNWSGSTGAGYEHYARDHSLSAAPAAAIIDASSDPAFHGDPTRLNPEQLLVMAAASCQMLSFLAIAARKRIDVVEYVDQAEGYMPEADQPMRITRIVLRPRIVITGSGDREQIQKMIELAHRQCFIANSLKTDIEIEASMEFRA